MRFTVPWVPDDPATQVSVFTTFASAQRGARWGQRQVLGAYTPEEERFVAGVAREGKYRLVKPPAGWGQ